MSRLKILLIAGHGGDDSGACAFGRREADLTREVAELLKDELLKFCDAEVFDTRYDCYSYLKKHYFNFTEYDYVMELHFNAHIPDMGNGKNKGSEILVHISEKETGVEETVLSHFESLGYTNRGVKKVTDKRNANVIKGGQGVSYALYEICFMDDADDMKIYLERKNETIKAIAEGIKEGFGIKEDKDVAGFKDTKGHWAEKDICELCGMGVANGFEDGSFRPDEPLTRAQAAALIRRAIRFITGK